MKKSGETGGAQSVRRALQLLSIVGSSSGGTSLAELCSRSELTRPTVYRLAATLTEEGFLRPSDEGRKLRLGPAFLELAQSSWSNFDLRGAAAFELQRLSIATDAAVRLMLHVDERMVCIEALGEDGGARFGVGASESLYGSAAGLAISAFDAQASDTEAPFADAELHLTRARFYALHCRQDGGAWSIAAPVFDEGGRAIAAISVSGPPHRFTQEDAHALSPEVIDAARQTSRAAGGYPFALSPGIAPDPEIRAKVDCLHRAANLNGDSPVISSNGKYLFWIDVLGPTLFQLERATGLVQSHGMPDVIGALVQREDGALIVGLANSVAVFDAQTGEVGNRSRIAGIPAGSRINDGGFDPKGRLWLGVIDNTLTEGTGRLIRLDSSGAPEGEITGLSLPNGIAWSPDGTTLYMVDSAKQEIRAYPYDTTTGNVGTPRRLRSFEGGTGRPAGLTIDHRGRLWTSLWDGWRLACLAPDGTLAEEIVVPIPRPSDLAIDMAGSPRLVFTSARARLTASQLSQAPLSGSLFAYGLPE